VDSRHVVLAFANDGESLGVLQPCFFEVAVKNGLTLSVEHTCCDNVSFDASTLRLQDKVLDLLDNAKLVRGLPSLVVLLGERVVQMASPDLLFLQERLVSILRAFVGDLRWLGLSIFALFTFSTLFTILLCRGLFLHRFFLFLFRPLLGIFPLFAFTLDLLLSGLVFGLLRAGLHELLELAGSGIPSHERGNEHEDLILTGLFFGYVLFEGINSQLNILRVSRVEIVDDQITFGDVLSGKTRFRTLYYKSKR
jgi:hypothetical protein